MTNRVLAFLIAFILILAPLHASAADKEIEDLDPLSATVALTDKLVIQTAASAVGYITTGSLFTLVEDLTDVTATAVVADFVPIQVAADSSTGFTTVAGLGLLAFEQVESLTNRTATAALTDKIPMQTAASATGYVTTADVLALLPAPDYAEIYVTGGVTAQTLSTTPTLLTAFAANGLANGATPAHGTDSITVATTGVYEVCIGTSMFGSNGAVILVVVYADAAPTQVGTKRTMSAANAVGPAMRCGLVSLAASQVVTAQVSASAATPNIVVERGNLSVVQIR